MSFGRTHVVILGGGAAALETCLALHALAGDSVLVTIVAPNTYFAYRPVGALDPLGICGRVRVPLAHVARAAGADLRHDRMTEIDTARRRIYTAAGYELAYDVLVMAVGATPLGVVPGAVALDPRRIADCRSAMHAVERGDLGSLAFVEPAGPTQELDVYDLVLQTAVNARRAGASPALTLVTAPPAPLAVAGARAADAVRITLASHGVRLVESAHLRAIVDGELDLVPGPHRVFAGRAIVAPRLGGRYPGHLPWDAEGFLPTDPFGRVQGTDHVFAAGDCTAFPVKHPSIATQQADAIAAAIAGDSQPFNPVLQCMLPSRLRWYLEAPLSGGHGDATRISAHPLWPGDARFGSRYLTPWLAELQRRHAGNGRGHANDDERVRDAHRAVAAVASH